MAATLSLMHVNSRIIDRTKGQYADDTRTLPDRGGGGARWMSLGRQNTDEREDKELPGCGNSCIIHRNNSTPIRAVRTKILQRKETNIYCDIRPP